MCLVSESSCPPTFVTIKVSPLPNPGESSSSGPPYWKSGFCFRQVDPSSGFPPPKRIFPEPVLPLPFLIQGCVMSFLSFFPYSGGGEHAFPFDFSKSSRHKSPPSFFLSFFPSPFTPPVPFFLPNFKNGFDVLRLFFEKGSVR